MAERERIARYFAPLTTAEPGSFSLSDDAAVLTPPAGYSLVLTTDSVIESIHILAHATPTQFAQKLMRRNLSDLAAMGATPWRHLLNMHTPPALPDAWFAEFSSALATEQTAFGMALIGGDSTSGGDRIHLTMTCIGLLKPPPLLRSGARPNDDIYVSGTIGDAALGLQLLQQKLTIATPSHHDFLTMRYHLPQPRLALGSALHSLATACIDISDGLLADAMQIAAASSAGICIERNQIPLSAAAESAAKTYPNSWERICNGGDDYELLFTAAPSKRDVIQSLSHKLKLPLTRIGTVTISAGVQLVDANHQPIILNDKGWEHQ